MKAQKGSVVSVNYRGTLEDGTEFDSSLRPGREPLTFEVGAGQMIPGFDKGVEGMEGGETKTLTLPPAEAYGEWTEERLYTIPRDRMPEGYTPTVGDRLMFGHMPVTVFKVTDEAVDLDGNHELCGKTLIFEVTLVSINN